MFKFTINMNTFIYLLINGMYITTKLPYYTIIVYINYLQNAIKNDKLTKFPVNCQNIQRKTFY